MRFFSSPRDRSSSSSRRRFRWLGYGLGGLALFGCIAILALYISLQRSLPIIEGELASGFIATAVSIERDALGVPAIRGSSRADVAFASGLAHAHDRFFQMDLLRRSAAGELAGLLGSSLIPADKSLRRHQFRSVAIEVLRDASEEERQLLLAYTAGVNFGLESLRARPWEYLLLRAQPQQWQPEDSLLVGLAMYLSLNDSSGKEEIERARLKQALAPQLFAFLHPIGTEWDAPIVGRAWRTPEIPGPEVLDLRQQTARASRHHQSENQRQHRDEVGIAFFLQGSQGGQLPGSNSWAVAATHSQSGAALLANDMHLGLRLPNVWYQARLIVEAQGDQARDVVGVMLPGLPLVVVGSNTHVAWGYTNSYGDWTDLIRVELDPEDASRYLTAEGSEPFRVHRERIEVRDADSVELEFKTTRWGPVIDTTFDDAPLVLAWTAHHPRATNLGMLAFERAYTVDDLLAAANRAGAPVQNVLAADAAGRIGWSLMGQIPTRGQYDTTIPNSWRNADMGWKGWREPTEYPRIVDPTAGRLWTANARTIDAQVWLALMGEGGYDLGARAAQIRDALLSDASATASEMAALQVDDRALFLNRWRDLALGILDNQVDPSLKEARALVQGWSGRASADDVGYRLVRAFRNEVRADVYGWLTASARLQDPGIEFTPSPQFEGPLWSLVTQKPAHLLPAAFESWDALLRASLAEALQELRQTCGSLSACTWGQENTLSLRHPLSAAAPFISRWVDMAQVPMNGDVAMPRVQSQSFGASQRLVVSPGREVEGLFQMPGGPVGHPLSPFYAAGHEQWVNGKPRALLPAEPTHVLRLVPQKP